MRYTRQPSPHDGPPRSLSGFCHRRQSAPSTAPFSLFTGYPQLVRPVGISGSQAATPAALRVRSRRAIASRHFGSSFAAASASLLSAFALGGGVASGFDHNHLRRFIRASESPATAALPSVRLRLLPPPVASEFFRASNSARFAAILAGVETLVETQAAIPHPVLTVPVVRYADSPPIHRARRNT